MKQESTNTAAALKEQIRAAYETDGGYTRAIEIAEDSNMCIYEHCKGCDNDMPVIKGQHECLICGQPTEPAAPTPVDSKQGDVLSKEGIKAKAEDLAKALGYNSNSLSLEVINVKDAFCIGYSEGRKESSPTLLKENGELKTLLKKAHEQLHTMCDMYCRDKEGYLNHKPGGWDAQLDIDIIEALNQTK